MFVKCNRLNENIFLTFSGKIFISLGTLEFLNVHLILDNILRLIHVI